MPSNKTGSTRVFMFFMLHDPKGPEQSPERQSTYDDLCNFSLAITNVVPRSNENVHTTTNFIGLEERSLK